MSLEIAAVPAAQWHASATSVGTHDNSLDPSYGIVGIAHHAYVAVH